MPGITARGRLVTVIIPTWRRPENVIKVIASIRKQSIPSYVYVLDNGVATDKPFRATTHADCVFTSTINWSSWARFPLMAFVRTPYVWQMDDDLVFTRPDVLEKYIALSKSLGDEWMIGAGGKVLNWKAAPDRHYPKVPQCYHGGHGAGPGPQAMVDTGFTLFPTRIANQIPMNPLYSDRPIDDEMLHNTDGIWACSYLRTRVTDLPNDGREWYGIARLSECGMGVSHEALHMHRRNLICWKYLREKKA